MPASHVHTKSLPSIYGSCLQEILPQKIIYHYVNIIANRSIFADVIFWIIAKLYWKRCLDIFADPENVVFHFVSFYVSSDLDAILKY